MPIEVDEQRRRDDIARATLKLAISKGPSAVTVRAIAAEMGGSTTMITNYLSNRNDLLTNAIRFVQRDWQEDQTRSLAPITEPSEKLRALIEWSTGTAADNDSAYRRIWLNLVAQRPYADDEAATVLREDAAVHRDQFRDALAAVGVDDEVGADALFLACRGFYFATTEDPEVWTSERAAAALGHLANALVSLRDG